MTQIILDGTGFAAHLGRMVTEIAARNAATQDVVVLGIQLGGVRLAQRLAEGLAVLWRKPVPHGALDVSMHRDDIGNRATPPPRSTELPGDVTGRTVVLADDVISSGRTTRAALDALHDFGRPQRVQLAVMVDRGDRELPIMPDFVGLKVAVAPEEHVSVRYAEDAGTDVIELTRGRS